MGDDLLAHLAGQGNQTTFSQSRAPTVAMDADGDFVVVWADSAADGSGYGVYGQRFDPAGSPQGDAFRVNGMTLSPQTLPSVAMDPDGDFVVSWSSLLQDGSLYGVYARRYNAAGEPQGGEFRVNQHTAGNQDFSAVAMDAQGDFVVAWVSQDQDGDRAGIFARRYDAAGSALGDEFQVNTTTSDNQRWPTVAMDAVGNFVVAWTSQAQDGSGGGIFAQRYYVDGAPLGEEFCVNTTTTGNQQYVSAAFDLDGTIFVWQSYDAAGSTWNVCSRRYDLDGAPVGDEVLLGEGRHASVTKTPGGDYAVAWETFDPARVEPSSIHVRHFDPFGLADGEPVRITNQLGTNQFGPAVASDGDRLVLMWTNDTTLGNGLDVRAVTMTVTPAQPRNHAPYFAPIADREIDEGQTLSLVASATDPDDPTAALTYSLAPGAPEGAAIDPATGAFQWTPSEAQGPGTFIVTVRATDEGAPPLTGATTFRVTVREVNSPPVVDPIEDQSIDEGATLSLVIPASDPDLPPGTLTFALAPDAPEGARLDAATGEFAWTPNESQGPGDYVIAFTVTDDGSPPLAVEGSFVVIIREVNEPPALDSIEDQTIDLGQTLAITAVAHDVDLPPNALIFNLVDPPAGASIDPVTGELTWTPTAEQGAGEYPFTVMVDDGQASDAASFLVTVETPILEAIVDQTIDEEQTLSVRLVGTPPYDLTSGVTLALAAGAPEGMAIDPATAILTWTPTESQGPGAYRVTVVATDATDPAARDTEAFTITVNEVNRPPEIAPIEDATIDELAIWTFQVVAVDPDVPPNQITFGLDAGPEGMEIDPVTGVLTWTPAEDQSSDVPYEVIVRATDDGEPSLFSTATFWITVNEVNAPPAIAPIADQTVDQGQTLTLTVEATDPDVPANVLAFSLDEAPAGAAIDPISGAFAWTVPMDEPVGDRDVVVRVIDDGDPALSATASFTITVETPLIDRPDDVAIDEGQTLQVAIQPTAPWTLAELTLSIVGLPAGATFDPVSGVLTWATAEEDGPSERTLTVRAQTSEAVPRVDTETFTIRVNEVNRPPVLSPEVVEDQTITAGESIELLFTAADPDIPANVLTFSLGDEAPDGAEIDPATGRFFWQTAADQPGTYPVTVRVTDDAAEPLSDEVTFSIIVANPNAAPAIDPIEDQTVAEGQTLALTVTAADPDGPPEKLAFSLADGAPPGASIDAVTGAFTWTPDEADGPGDHDVTVWVTDAGAVPAQASITFVVHVTEVNLPPALDPVGDQTLAEGQSLDLTLGAVDPDVPANALTFQLDAGAPDGMALDAQTGRLTWTPGSSHGGQSYTVTARVTDNGAPPLDDAVTFLVTVTELNHAPVVEPIADRSIAEGDLLDITVLATDGDDPPDALTFSLDPGAPAGATIDAASGMLLWQTGEADGPGTYSFTVRATDDGAPNLSGTTTFLVHVEEVNEAPALEPLADRSVAEGETVAFTAAAADPDDPPNALIFSLDPGAPAGATIDPTTGAFSWTPGESHGLGSYSVTIRVTDDGAPALSDAASFVIHVTEANAAPVFQPIADCSIAEGTTLELVAVAFDADLPANQLTYSLVEGPPGATIHPRTGLVRWSTAKGDAPAARRFTLRATDDGDPALADEVSFLVTVVDASEAPKLFSLLTRVAAEHEPFSCAIPWSDPEGPTTPVTFRLEPGGPEGATIDAATGEFRWTPGEEHGGLTHAFTISMFRDAAPHQVVQTLLRVRVNERNASPVLAVIADQTLVEGDSLALEAVATDEDVPADLLTYSLAAGAPEGMTVDRRTGHVAWTPGPGQGPGEYAVTLEVADSGWPAGRDARSFTVTIVAAAPGDAAAAPPSAPPIEPLADAGSAETSPSLSAGARALAGNAGSTAEQAGDGVSRRGYFGPLPTTPLVAPRRPLRLLPAPIVDLLLVRGAL